MSLQLRTHLTGCTPSGHSGRRHETSNASLNGVSTCQIQVLTANRISAFGPAHTVLESKYASPHMQCARRRRRSRQPCCQPGLDSRHSCYSKAGGRRGTLRKSVAATPNRGYRPAQHDGLFDQSSDGPGRTTGTLDQLLQAAECAPSWSRIR